MTTMLAVEIAHSGGPEVLTLASRPMPVPGAGEILIEVHASGVNRADILQRQGHYPPPAGVSDLPGLEVAGTLIDGDLEGDNPFGLRRGDAVCALLAGGGYAQYAVAPLAQCLPIPRGLDTPTAAAIPEAFFTVWSNVFERAQLGRSESGAHESLLVQGGASGIGVAAVQLAHAFGHPVVAVAGGPEKCRALEDLGATAVDRHTEDFVQCAKALTGGRGVDVILDIVAGDIVDRELDALADDGRLVIIAYLGGARSSFNAATLMRKRATLTGSTLRGRSVEFKAAIARRLHESVWPLFERGAIRPAIYRVFPAAEASRAHALMESGTHIGKLVLRW